MIQVSATEWRKSIWLDLLVHTNPDGKLPRLGPVYPRLQYHHPCDEDAGAAPSADHWLSTRLRAPDATEEKSRAKERSSLPPR